jgi:hypothetical protein
MVANIESGDLHPTTGAILFHCTPSRTNVEETHTGFKIEFPEHVFYLMLLSLFEGFVCMVVDAMGITMVFPVRKNK